MIHFAKRNAEPPALGTRRRTPDLSGWDLGPATSDVREALEADQFGLCAYCNRRLDEGWRIEHWVPRSVAPEKTYEWTNLLGVCSGHSGERPHDSPALPDPLEGRADHCDRARGNAPLSLNPSHPGVSASLTHSRTGRVRGASDEATTDVRTLNLNQWRLTSNRKDVWENAERILAKAKWSDSVLNQLEKASNSPDQDGRLPPYAGTVRFALTKWWSMARGLRAQRSRR